MSLDVFLSIGTPWKKEQERFVGALETFLRERGLNPRALGRSEWSNERPLHFIHRVMSECTGTVVIAYERVRITSGSERRGHADEKLLSDAVLPSVWNQIEAAMAYELGHPLLVIAEDGLRHEGLLEDGHDWVVQRLPLRPSAFEGPAFQDAFRGWKAQVEARAAGTLPRRD